MRVVCKINNQKIYGGFVSKNLLSTHSPWLLYNIYKVKR